MNGWLVTIIGGLIVGFILLGVQLWVGRRSRILPSEPSLPVPDVPSDPGPPLPEVTDQELWILREMAKYGDRAYRRMHDQRASSGRTGTVDSFWIGEWPVDYYESTWISEALNGTLLDKGFVDRKGTEYRTTLHGQRAVQAHRNRQLAPMPPIIDALTGQPRA